MCNTGEGLRKTESADRFAWKEPQNKEEDRLLFSVRPAWPLQNYSGHVCTVWTSHIPHLGLGMKPVQPPLIPHILSLSLIEQDHKNVRATLIWVASADVAQLPCCATPHVAIRCWEKQSCHPGPPLPGSEGQCQTATTVSLPACDTWHTLCHTGLKDFSL